VRRRHGLQLLPAPVVHPDLATSASLPAADEQRTAAAIKIGFAEGEGLVDAKAGSPQHDDQSAKPTTLDTVAGATHDRDDLLDSRRIGRIAPALVARRTTNPQAGHRRR
jgi:hypothetical protein